MRRILLLVVGLGAGGAVLFALCTGAAAQYAQPLVTVAATEAAIQLPCWAEGTELVAVCLAAYDGPFLEDGSDEEVVGVTALVVENQSGIMIRRGAVILEQGQRLLVFEFSALPPDARILILEKDRQYYSKERISGCWGWTRGEYPENMGQARVTEAGDNELCFTNMSGGYLYETEAMFKHYDPDSGMYIGGISYPVSAAMLAPGESRRVPAYRYVEGYSRVVRVCVFVE